VALTAMNALADGSSATGLAIDNSSLLNQFADLLLDIKFGTNPSAGGYVALYIVPAIDNTNYADFSATTSVKVGTFPVQASTSAQKVALMRVPIPPCAFKFIVLNKAGQTTSANNTDSQLTYVATAFRATKTWPGTSPKTSRIT
jgi:hypothetical protein